MIGVRIIITFIRVASYLSISPFRVGIKCGLFVIHQAEYISA